ncbi:MAG: hypothetical protein AB1782_12520 [Cyanobacteriota bacterium]
MIKSFNNYLTENDSQFPPVPIFCAVCFTYLIYLLIWLFNSSAKYCMAYFDNPGEMTSLKVLLFLVYLVFMLLFVLGFLYSLLIGGITMPLLALISTIAVFVSLFQKQKAILKLYNTLFFLLINVLSILYFLYLFPNLMSGNI